MVLKICGITRVEDAQHAVAHGATAIGFVCWGRSPRYVAADRIAAIVSALAPSVTTVGVFVNETMPGVQAIVERTGISMVQLHGDETARDAGALRVPIIRSMTLENGEALSAEWPDDTTFLLDAADPVQRGGTGKQVDWAMAARVAARRRVILAGGLTSLNVAEAIALVRPWGVDVSSGVEASPGVKNPDAVAAFLAHARAAFADVGRVPLDPPGNVGRGLLAPPRRPGL
jgi:phosphoribosylanthranilate isomerase